MTAGDWAFLVVILICILLLVRLPFAILRHRHSAPWVVGNIVLTILLIALFFMLFFMIFPAYRLDSFGSMMFFII